MTYREAQERKKKRMEKLKKLKQFYEEFSIAFLEIIYGEKDLVYKNKSHENYKMKKN